MSPARKPLVSPLAAHRRALREAAARRARLDHPKPEPRPKDWRTDAQRAADAKLDGFHWRCPTHGVRDDVVMLGDHPYCDDADCTRPVLIVSVLRVSDEEKESRRRPWLERRFDEPPVIDRADEDRVCWIGACSALIARTEAHVVGVRGGKLFAWCMDCARRSGEDQVRDLATGNDSCDN